MDAAEILKLCRKHAKLSLVALSAASTVSTTTIQKVEHGEQDCRISTFEKLLDAMGYELEVVRKDE